MTSNNSRNKIMALSFPPEKSAQPVICNLTRLFDLTFNILKARINPRQEGSMTIELIGRDDQFKDGIAYLSEKGIKAVPVSQHISRDEESCMHCGLCTAMCPSQALELNLETRYVQFDPLKCTACGLCTKICPVHAMLVGFDNDL